MFLHLVRACNRHPMFLPHGSFTPMPAITKVRPAQCLCGYVPGPVILKGGYAENGYDSCLRT